MSQASIPILTYQQVCDGVNSENLFDVTRFNTNLSTFEESIQGLGYNAKLVLPPETTPSFDFDRLSKSKCNLVLQINPSGQWAVCGILSSSLPRTEPVNFVHTTAKDTNINALPVTATLQDHLTVSYSVLQSWRVEKC